MTKKKLAPAKTFEEVSKFTHIDPQQVVYFGFTDDPSRLGKSQVAEIYRAAGGQEKWLNIAADEILRDGRPDGAVASL